MRSGEKLEIRIIEVQSWVANFTYPARPHCVNEVVEIVSILLTGQISITYFVPQAKNETGSHERIPSRAYLATRHFDDAISAACEHESSIA